MYSFIFKRIKLGFEPKFGQGAWTTTWRIFLKKLSCFFLLVAKILYIRQLAMKNKSLLEYVLTLLGHVGIDLCDQLYS